MQRGLPCFFVILLVFFAARPAFADPPTASDAPKNVSPKPQTSAAPVPTAPRLQNEACKECEANDASAVARPIDERPRQRTARAETRGRISEWYGWQGLIADLTSMGLVFTGFRSTPVFLLGCGTYTLGGPIIHLAHGNPAEAGGSFFLRVGLGVAGVFVGGAVGNDPESGAGPVLGLLAGMLAASVIDAAALGYEDVDATERRRPQKGLSVRRP